MFLIISILGFGRKNSVQALNLVNFCGIMSFWEEIVGIDCEANPFSVQKRAKWLQDLRKNDCFCLL
jgi:hypothetical protein